MVLAFLQGLALDAYITMSTSPKWAICLDSRGLLDDLQAVLTNLGVVHGRVSKYNRQMGKAYDEVYAAGPQAQLMVSLVPFLEPEKAARAAELLRASYGPGTPMSCRASRGGALRADRGLFRVGGVPDALRFPSGSTHAARHAPHDRARIDPARRRAAVLAADGS